MIITRETLNKRLNWTLDQKIDHSLFTIENALTYSNGNAYVSFSGGKDSTILLHLVRIIKPDIKAVFFNTTNEFPEIYKFIKEIDCIKVQPEMNLKSVIEKCGFPLISKEQAQYIREARTTKSEKLLELRLNGRKCNQGKISNKWQHLINAPFDISEKCCYHLKKRPAYKFEKENKLFPIIGTSVNESRLRLQKYLTTGCNAFEVNRPASYPISIWTDKDKWNFIKQNKIPYCEIYDKGETQTGCMICGFGCHKDDRFIRLKETQPKAFEIGMNYKNNGVTYDVAIQTALKKPMCGGILSVGSL
jgi:3'-phosphoadenosine 5'-phosphosulfate sulfotransferase (PAPS reductase)/FAD synthetase